MIWNTIVCLLHAIFCRTSRSENREATQVSADPSPTALPSSESEEASSSENTSECEELILSKSETSSECEEFSDSERESESSNAPALRIYTTPQSRHQLIIDYQLWMREQHISPKKPSALITLRESANQSEGTASQFARITQLIIEKHPSDYSWFCMTILSKLHPRLETGFALAVETGDIEPLMTALGSSTS